MNPESERGASAAIDWLETRDDVDARRVGVVAMSLGGYYAPRAAAFEKRLAASVAWGARWENSGSHGRILRDPNAARSVTNWVEHALWYYGARCSTKPTTSRLMTLEDCGSYHLPLLVVHGGTTASADRAGRTHGQAAVNIRAELRVSQAEGRRACRR
jgi:hypothetical protein